MSLKTLAALAVLAILIVATVMTVSGWGGAQEAGRLKAANALLLVSGYAGLIGWGARSIWWKKATNEWNGVSGRF